MVWILTNARKYGLSVVENAAQRVNSWYEGWPHLAILGTYSFHETRNKSGQQPMNSWNIPEPSPSGNRKVVAIVQSNYIPWKGYFDLINAADEFILFDDMQFTRRDWRNRNKIKTPSGPAWLTIPVQVKGKYFQRIDETLIADKSWARSHWATIQHCYGRARFFGQYKAMLEELYLGCTEEYLSRVNHRFLLALCEALRIPTRLTWSTDYQTAEGKTERLVRLCLQAGATHYLSGPSARDYLDETLFQQAGLAVCWAHYDGYPEYQQLHPPFDHFVSVIDLLFNEGANAPHYLLTTEERPEVENEWSG